MKILTRYLLKEMIVPFLIGQAAIVLLLTGSVLYNNANVFLQNQVPIWFVVRLALYFIPFLIHMTMPVAMAVAASLAVSRLGRDSEITVLRASGCSLVRIFMPIFVTGLVVSVGDFLFGEYVVPPAILRYQAVIDELPTLLKRISPPAGQWIVASDNSYVIKVQNMSQKRDHIDLIGVIIISGVTSPYGQHQAFTALADTGRYESGKWILFNPQIYSYDAKDKTKHQVLNPDKLIKPIPVDPQSFASGFILQMPMGQMAGSATRTFKDLGEELKRDKSQGITDYYALIDYHFKLSVPFSCLVMALCCAPMALRFARGGGFMGTLLSICLVFVYWNTLLLARILGTPGAEGALPLMPPSVAAWSQNVLFILLGIWVLRRSE